jgi:hypothetical protein
MNEAAFIHSLEWLGGIGGGAHREEGA